MNPDKQRIAINEALGWTRKSGSMNYDGCVMPWTIWSRDGQEVGGDRMPDYLIDLNAIHEAEKHLRLERPYDWMKYCRNVCNFYEPDAIAIQATAEQRAEAFLRTIGKWDAVSATPSPSAPPKNEGDL